MMLQKKIKILLFDLDGTLLDTAPDLAGALNELLIRHQRKPLPYKHIRPIASHGARGLLHLGFNITENDPHFAERVKEFLALYHQRLCQETQFFKGIKELLDELTAKQFSWGIVTNKPDWLTRPLLAHFDLLSKAACVVSGDTINKRKPDPAPLLHACQLILCNPSDCVYMGDAQRDVEAGKRAGMQTLVALYGYIGLQEKPESWGADGMITDAREVMEWLRSKESN